jgi:hypothetical protein
MGDAMKGQQVVLAQRLHGDIFGEHQLVVARVVRESGQVELSRSEQLDEGVATRRGVSDRCSELGFLPRAVSRSATACSTACRSRFSRVGTTRRLA